MKPNTSSTPLLYLTSHALCYAVLTLSLQLGCTQGDDESPTPNCTLDTADPGDLGVEFDIFSPEHESGDVWIYLAVDVGAMDTTPDSPTPTAEVPAVAYTPASVTVLNTTSCVAETFVVDLRYKGNTTFDKPKRQYKVKWPKGSDLNGLRALNLHSAWKDATLFREKLTAEFFEAMGVVAPRANHVRVYLQNTGGTGGYEYQGLYTAVEQVEDTFFKDRYGDGGGEGNLYKAYYGVKGSSGTGFADLRVVGDGSPASYRGGNGWADTYEGKARAYRLKTNEDEGMEDYADLASLIGIINTGDDQALAAAFDVDGFITWLAANTLLGGWDNYWLNAQNYYLYQEEPGAVWRWIPWDHDNTLGNNFQDHNGFHIESQDIYYGGFPNNVLIQRVLEVPEWRAQYQARLRDGLDLWFNETHVGERIGHLHTYLGEAAAEDPLKQYSDEECTGNQDNLIITHSDEDGDFGNKAHHLGILDYVAKRASSVRMQLGDE